MEMWWGPLLVLRSGKMTWQAQGWSMLVWPQHTVKCELHKDVALAEEVWPCSCPANSSINEGVDQKGERQTSGSSVSNLTNPASTLTPLPKFSLTIANDRSVASERDASAGDNWVGWGHTWGWEGAECCQHDGWEVRGMAQLTSWHMQSLYWKEELENEHNKWSWRLFPLVIEWGHVWVIS